MANFMPFQSFGSRLSLCLMASVMPWPLMFSIAGTVKGIGCAPRPSEVAIGIGARRCAAACSLLMVLWRITAQPGGFAPPTLRRGRRGVVPAPEAGRQRCGAGVEGGRGGGGLWEKEETGRAFPRRSSRKFRHCPVACARRGSDNLLSSLARQLGFRGQTFLNRQRRIARPFVPRPKIHAHILHARIFEREEGVRCPRTLEAIEIDRGILRNTDGRAFGKNFVPGLEALSLGCRLHHAIPFEPDGTRDTSLAWTRVLAIGRGAFADPLVDVADVEQCDVWLAKRRKHGFCIDEDIAGFRNDCEVSWRRCGNVDCDRQALGCPSVEPAIKYLDPGIAEHGQEIIAAAGLAEAGVHRLLVNYGGFPARQSGLSESGVELRFQRL